MVVAVALRSPWLLKAVTAAPANCLWRVRPSNECNEWRAISELNRLHFDTCMLGPPCGACRFVQLASRRERGSRVMSDPLCLRRVASRSAWE